MSKNLVVDVLSRSQTGKNASRRLRRSGSIPAVLYGEEKPAVSLTVEPSAIREILSTETRENTLFQLRLDGAKDKTRHVMIRDRQQDPVTGELVHVDFIRIDLEKKVQVEVPIQIVGVAEGVKNEGGLLDFIERTVQVSCLPQDIPDTLEVDVTEFHVGQVFRVKDLAEDPKHEVLSDPERPILVISSPPVAEAEAAPAEGEAVVEGEAPAEAAAEESEPATEEKSQS